ncbi:MAG TPA: type II toxin-antitoxin system VapC family toxin [Burkholderiaceae bacterium]|nr:type II toxin-antitoxin system VapC family toxin [Burkholderiaceae bacterium]
MIVLDTHVLVWADSADRQLGRKTRALIERMWAGGKVAVPAIAFWEVGLLHARRRLRLPIAVGEWRDAILTAGAVELPLDGAVAIRALDLTGLHDDPADRFIIATALIHGATLVTADQRLLDWRHPLDRHDART